MQRGQWQTGIAGLLLAAMIFVRAQADNFSDGATAFSLQDYKTALRYFEAASHETPGNADVYYYLGVSYAKTNQPEQARSALMQALSLAPPGSAMAAQAKEALARVNHGARSAQGPWTNQANQISQTGQTSSAETTPANQAADAPDKADTRNYAKEVSSEGLPAYWEAPSMPLKVYIETQPLDPALRPLAIHALDEWCGASGGKVSYQLADREADAGITLHWVSHLDAGEQLSGSSAQHKGGITYPQCVPQKNFCKFIKADIQMPLRNTFNQSMFSDGELHGFVLHELGHALFSWGHSSDPRDIMFFEGNRSWQLSQADKNTICTIYNGGN